MSAVAVCATAVTIRSQAPAPTRGVTDPGVITTRQRITPAGVQAVFDGRVYGIAFGGQDDELWVMTGRNKAGRPQVYQFEWLANRVRDSWTLSGTPALQGLVLDPVRKTPLVGVTRPASEAGNRAGGAVQLLQHDGTSSCRWRPISVCTWPDLRPSRAAAPATAPCVPLVFDNALAVIDAKTGRLEGKVKTGGVAPFGAVISRDGRAAWVSNWGGRWPVDGDVTLPTGMAPDADRVVVDSRGIASTGTISRIDLEARRVSKTLSVELHPTAMAWDEPRHRLFVANANSDTVTVIDTDAQRVAATLPLRPFGLTLKGIAPTALVVAPDGRTLFVALGGLNAVAVVAIPEGRIRGFIPTAWYPNHLVLNSDGTKLAVSTLLGAGSGWQNDPGVDSCTPTGGGQRRLRAGRRPARQLHDRGRREQPHATTAPAAAGGQPGRDVASPVPQRAGEPSVFEHVIYIIKENRTYDQVFGDMKEGNGDPTLVHVRRGGHAQPPRARRQFMLLDNFYCTGGSRADGHRGSTQAYVTDYLERGRRLHAAAIPTKGATRSRSPRPASSGTTPWRTRRRFRNYGEYCRTTDTPANADVDRLLRRLARTATAQGEDRRQANIAQLERRTRTRNYPGFPLTTPDVYRAQMFLDEFETN